MLNGFTPIIPITCASDYDIPARGSLGAAGFDLRATNAAEIYPGEVAAIKTGLRLDMSQFPNIVAMIYPRSGLGTKRGLILANGTGVVDSDYQGEITVFLWNRNHDSDWRPEYINIGDRIAQMVFLPVVIPTLVRVDSFANETQRGENGFGSTGVK